MAAPTLRALVAKPAGVVVELVAILRVEKLAKVGSLVSCCFPPPGLS